jgi:DNA ligase (NAD+)
MFMNKIQAEKEVLRLRREIEEHNYRYYVLDDPLVSDGEYDRLMKDLLALEEEFPGLASPFSVTQRVGAKVPSGVRTVPHAVRMLSLDNTYSVDELKAWSARVYKGLGARDVEFVSELKIDGVSASLLYEGGELVLGATRGDGEVGEDVTHNIRAMGCMPLRLRHPGQGEVPRLIEVRGEVYMDKAAFNALNDERRGRGEDVFANPRNAASGSLKLLDPGESARRKLRFFAHSFGRLEGGAPVNTHWEFLALARELGFPVNAESRVRNDFSAVVRDCLDLQGRRAALPYDVDGVVVKVNSFAQEKELGETMKCPRWAVAFKFPAYQATTRIKAIEVQVGRTGVLTPVAELEPVACGGVVIARATLHNFDELSRLGAHPGDRVLIERAGDVIPRIVKVVESCGEPQKVSKVPGNCRACREEYICEEEGQVAYRCINPACPRQLERRVIHFASRDAMDIGGLGEAVAQELVARNLVSSVADIYTLKKEDLTGLPFFADKKADNLCQAIDQSKSRPLSRLVFGLGILNIGQKASVLLARHFQSMERLRTAEEKEILSIHELGEVSARSVVRFFAQKETSDILDKISRCGVNMMEPAAPLSQGPLNGMVFVFTGELSGRSRSEAGEAVRGLGAQVQENVTRSTTAVVAGRKPGSKLTKAEKLGIKVMNEQEFEEMLHDKLST